MYDFTLFMELIVTISGFLKNFLPVLLWKYLLLVSGNDLLPVYVWFSRHLFSSHLCSVSHKSSVYLWSVSVVGLLSIPTVYSYSMFQALQCFILKVFPCIHFLSLFSIAFPPWCGSPVAVPLVFSHLFPPSLSVHLVFPSWVLVSVRFLCVCCRAAFCCSVLPGNLVSVFFLTVLSKLSSRFLVCVFR